MGKKSNIEFAACPHEQKLIYDKYRKKGLKPKRKRLFVKLLREMRNR